MLWQSLVEKIKELERNRGFAAGARFAAKNRSAKRTEISASQGRTPDQAGDTGSDVPVDGKADPLS